MSIMSCGFYISGPRPSLALTAVYLMNWGAFLNPFQSSSSNTIVP